MFVAMVCAANVYLDEWEVAIGGPTVQQGELHVAVSGWERDETRCSVRW